MAELRLNVAGYPDSDDEERADLAWRLERELREHGVDEVAHPAIRPPPGAKGGALEWAQLVVSFAGTVPALVMALEGWRGRHPGAAVTLEIEGDRLTLDHASPAEQRRLVEVFLANFTGQTDYRVDGRVAGSYFCFVRDGQPSLYAIDRRANVGVRAEVYHGSGDPAIEKLVDLWSHGIRIQP